MSLQYTVLSHTGSPEGDHVDFLIEQEAGRGDLLTFRLPGWPVSHAVDATRLRNHRRLYLTYEGILSGGRGSVVRLLSASGNVALASGVLVVTLQDGSTLEFHPEGDDRYIARPAPPRPQ